MVKILLSKKGIIKINRKGDINTQYGIIKRKDIAKARINDLVTTHKGEKILVTSPSYEDFIEIMKRGPQIITLKDIGEIIVFANINKKSRVLEIGTGAGTVGIIISQIAKEVISYDIRSDFLDLAIENAKIFNAKNIKFKQGSIKEEKESFDSVIIDIPNPEEVIEKSFEVLKKGGYLVTYLPSISQIFNLISKYKFENYKVMQINKIDWIIDTERNIERPENMQLYHTGFLLFSRKIF
ncbi:MAG: methyltransferase domain-containing protein [Candidatus Parvarchaeota archaeon]|nr:methyltransferase domain-containing protein [Candidatus Rehaiarchaeum fermentans]